MVAQLLTLDAAEDKVLASVGDGITCLVVHVGLLIDCYRHDVTGTAIAGPINGTKQRLDMTKELSLRRVPNIAFTC